MADRAVTVYSAFPTWTVERTDDQLWVKPQPVFEHMRPWLIFGLMIPLGTILWFAIARPDERVILGCFFLMGLLVSWVAWDLLRGASDEEMDKGPYLICDLSDAVMELPRHQVRFPLASLVLIGVRDDTPSWDDNKYTLFVVVQRDDGDQCSYDVAGSAMMERVQELRKEILSALESREPST